MNKDAVAGYTGSTQRVALTGSSWRTMSHARNVKTSPGKAAGTKCVKVYPQIQIRLREQAFFSPYKKLNIRLDKFSCFIYTYSRYFLCKRFSWKRILSKASQPWKTNNEWTFLVCAQQCSSAGMARSPIEKISSRSWPSFGHYGRHKSFGEITSQACVMRELLVGV